MKEPNGVTVTLLVAAFLWLGVDSALAQRTRRKIVQPSYRAESCRQAIGMSLQSLNSPHALNFAFLARLESNVRFQEGENRRRLLYQIPARDVSRQQVDNAIVAIESGRNSGLC